MSYWAVYSSSWVAVVSCLNLVDWPWEPSSCYACILALDDCFYMRLASPRYKRRRLSWSPVIRSMLLLKVSAG